MMKWLVGVLVVAVAVAASLWYFVLRDDGGAPQYETAAVARADVERTASGSGTVQPTSTITVRVYRKGTVTAVAVEEGAGIEPGAELFRVNDKPTFALTSDTPFYRTIAADNEGPDVEALQTMLRDLDYYDGDVTGEYDADTQEAVKDFLEDRDQDRTEKVGPETFQSVGDMPDGAGLGSRGAPMVARLDLVVGQIAQSGMTAFVTVPRQMLEAEIDLNELDMPLVQSEQRVMLTLDALPGREFAGVVKTVSPGTVATGAAAQARQAGETSGPRGVVTFPVTISFTDPTAEVLVGMSVDATIVVATAQQVLSVPTGSVQDQEGTEVVLVPGGEDDPGGVLAVPVKIGLRSDDLVEVTEGLSEGQAIIVGLDPDSIVLPDQGILGVQTRPNALPIGTDTTID